MVDRDVKKLLGDTLYEPVIAKETIWSQVMYRINVINAPFAPVLLTASGEIVIGSDKECDIVLVKTDIAPQHARIIWGAKGCLFYCLADLTWVNDQPLIPGVCVPLHHGYVIHIGSVKLSIEESVLPDELPVQAAPLHFLPNSRYSSGKMSMKAPIEPSFSSSSEGMEAATAREEPHAKYSAAPKGEKNWLRLVGNRIMVPLIIAGGILAAGIYYFERSAPSLPGSEATTDFVKEPVWSGQGMEGRSPTVEATKPSKPNNKLAKGSAATILPVAKSSPATDSVVAPALKMSPPPVEMKNADGKKGEVKAVSSPPAVEGEKLLNPILAVSPALKSSPPLAKEATLPVVGKASVEKKSAATPTRQANDKVNKKEHVANLLKMAQQDFAEQRLTLPKGNNAWDHYLEVLNLSPRHPEAVKGIRRIVSDLREHEKEARKQGHVDKAKLLAQKANIVEASINATQKSLAERTQLVNGAKTAITKNSTKTTLAKPKTKKNSSDTDQPTKSTKPAMTTPSAKSSSSAPAAQNRTQEWDVFH